MKYSIDKSSPTPAYLQLYSQLRDDIINGTIKYGDKLPSKRTIAEETGVSQITAEHAYAILADEGYIISRERSGHYAAYTLGKSPAKPGQRPSVEEMSAADEVPEDFPFSVLAKLMRKVLTDYDRRILSSAPNCGCMSLRAAISEYLQRNRGIKARPEQIIIGSGAEYMYALVVQLLGREGVYALESPSYDKIRQVYEANGARVEMLKLGDDGILSEELEKSKAGALHVTPFHSFPSGITASAAKRREYAAWAEKNKAYIIEDDYDSEFSALRNGVETVFSLAPDRVIYINSFSKTISPAMRTAYMILPEALLPLYDERLGFYSCTVPVYNQLVLAEFIASGELERYINRMRRKLRRG